MFFTTAIVLSGLLAVQQVSATPLRVIGPHEGTTQKKEHVTKAVGHAHTAVEHMEQVHAKAKNGDHTALGHIHHAFGTSANLDHIGSHIQKLKTGKFQIHNADHPTMHGAGAYDPNTKEVHFGTAFHTGTEKQRAGHVLHEASHHILGTKDVFNQHGHPIDAQRADPAKHEHSGYADSGLHTIKNGVAAGNMHHNADSWRVFGNRVAPHLVERREMAVLKREILREILARFDAEDFDELD